MENSTVQKINEKRLFIIAVVVLCLCALMAAGSTIAYYTYEEHETNVITTGDVSIRIQEWADEEKTVPFPEEGIQGVMPSSVVTKIAEAVNTGEQDAWLRCRIDVKVTLADGTEGDPTPVTYRTGEGWTQKEDGYLYYNQPLAGGKTSTPVITAVSFDGKMGNEYMGCTADVIVTIQAVQVKNNPNALGWPDD